MFLPDVTFPTRPRVRSLDASPTWSTSHSHPFASPRVRGLNQLLETRAIIVVSGEQHHPGAWTSTRSSYELRFDAPPSVHSLAHSLALS